MADALNLAFHIQGEPEEILGRLVVEEPDGGLVFGPTARSSSTRSQLREGVTFRDYLMEGFVAYDLRILPDPGGVRIEIRSHGSSRDKYLNGHIRWILTVAKVHFTETG